MPWMNETEIDGDLKTIFRFDSENKAATRIKVFEIDSTKELVLSFPNDRFLDLEKFEFIGFVKRPNEMNVKGKIKTAAAHKAVRRIVKDWKVTRFIVTKSEESAFTQLRSGTTIKLSYDDFKVFLSKMRKTNTANQLELRNVADTFFRKIIPIEVTDEELSAQSRLTKMLTSLDRTIIKEMSGEEINQLVDFTSAVVNERYIATGQKRKLTLSTKLKFDSVAIDQVIQGYEDRFENAVSESNWGKFLKQNLYMVESRYVHIFDRLNVISAGAREVDFGLIDTHGFLDIFEIKTPLTKLLAAAQDRGNYYWNTHAIKAITQAEKYLYNAERRGPTLAQDIRRELNLDVSVIKPRAILVLGHSRQLDNDNKREDFRVLRMSLKNIEIILYDELLERLKNQRDKANIGQD